jgi:DNA polymerase-1
MGVAHAVVEALMLAIDTETNHTRWWDGSPVFLVQWSDECGDDCAAHDDAAGIKRFCAAVDAHDDLLFANASFDVHMLRSSNIVDLLRTDKRLLDVQTLARVVLPERGFKGYKLKQLGVDLLGADADEEQRTLKELMSQVGIRTLNAEGAHRALYDVFPRQLEAYGMKDTRLTYDLYKLLWGRATKFDRRVFEDIEVPVQRLLMLMEERGAGVDSEALAVLRADLEQRERETYTALTEYLPVEALGDDNTAASQTALREGLLAAGVPLYRTTDKTGALATNRDALSEFEDTCPVVGLLFAWRKLSKILSTYVAPLERGAPRVHTSYISSAARTSRMSSRSPNLQNLPRGEAGRDGARSVIVPDPGCALSVVDYDSIEVRVLAHYLARGVGNRGLVELLESGVDMHTATAAKVFGRPAGFDGDPLEYYAKGGPGDDKRTLAKTTTFSSLYGIGYRKLALRLGIPDDEAKALKQAILDAIPGYWDLFESVGQRVSRVHYLRTVTGRKLDVPLGKSHIYLNTIIQGTAAEIMKLGMLAAEEPLADWGYLPVLVVHDELVSEGPADHAASATEACIAAMESVGSLPDKDGLPLMDCPIKATGGYTTTNYEAAK